MEDRGPVQGLVGQALAGAPVAEEGHRYPRLALELEGVGHAGNDPGRGRKVTDEPDEAEAQVAHAVQISVAPATDARRPSEELGQNAPGCSPRTR